MCGEFVKQSEHSFYETTLFEVLFLFESKKDQKSLFEFCHIQKFDWYSTSRLETYCSFKGWCKKNYTTIVKMNIAAFRGYNCILYWLVKLITEISTFQKAILTIFVVSGNAALQFDKIFWQIGGCCKNQFCSKIDVNLDSDIQQKPTLTHQIA